MEKRTNSPFPAIDRPVMALVGVVLVIGTGLFMWSDRAHDWRFYQMEFSQLVAEQFGADKAADVPTGLQQIWVADLERADRCTTCHLGVAWKGFEKADHPYRTHPEAPLKTHPLEKFGCTSCHSGAGAAARAGRSIPRRPTAKSLTGRNRCSAARSASRTPWPATRTP